MMVLEYSAGVTFKYPKPCQPLVEGARYPTLPGTELRAPFSGRFRGVHAHACPGQHSPLGAEPRPPAGPAPVPAPLRPGLQPRGRHRPPAAVRSGTCCRGRAAPPLAALGVGWLFFELCLPAARDSLFHSTQQMLVGFRLDCEPKSFVSVRVFAA